MKTLVPCSGCGRHVRASDSACPFCGHAIESDASLRAAPRPNGARIGRAAIFAFGATLAATSAIACSPSNPGGDAQAQDGSVQDAGNMALYGAPAPDSGVGDDGSPGARYGAVPAPDADDTDASDGSPGARYGAPPTDAG